MSTKKAIENITDACERLAEAHMVVEGRGNWSSLKKAGKLVMDLMKVLEPAAKDLTGKQGWGLWAVNQVIGDMEKTLKDLKKLKPSMEKEVKAE
jgi:hypothetical protein